MVAMEIIGQPLGLRVICGGTEAEEPILKQLGYRNAQEFRFGRPMTPAGFGDWLDQRLAPPVRICA